MMEVVFLGRELGFDDFRVETQSGYVQVSLFPDRGKVFFSSQQGSLTIDDFPSLFEKGRNDQVYLSPKGKDVFGYCQCGERAVKSIPLGWDSRMNCPASEGGCLTCYEAAVRED